MRTSKLWPNEAFRTVAGWTLVVVAMCGASSRCFATAAEAALFEGFWALDADPDAAAERGGRLDFKEYFIIESGVVTASELSKLGFEPTPATFTTDAAGNTTWSVTMTSRTQGTLTITGWRTTGSAIAGSIVWDRDGQTYRYAYAGRPFTPTEE